MRKNSRLKIYKHDGEADIRRYIKKFDEELKSLKVMVGNANDLEKAEYVPILEQLWTFKL